MFKSILVPFDGSELAVHALSYAAALARASHARLVLIYAPAPWELSIDAPARLHSASTELRQAGIAATAQVANIQASNPGRAILTVAGEVAADVVVIGSHAYGTMGRALFGSVADYVIRHATVPVLICTPQANRPWPEERPRRLLVPLDGSALAETALAPAEQFARAIGASVDLVGVVDAAIMAVVPDSAPSATFLATLVAETDHNLERLAEGLRERRVVTDVHARAGVPERVITQLADELPADIIVMASHGRGGVARVLLGSVALKVVQRSAVPVLLIQPASVSAQRAKTRRNAREEAPDREQTRRDAERLPARLPSPA
jgi:nucleotide-binding universal stress UspA family protein